MQLSALGTNSFKVGEVENCPSPVKIGNCFWKSSFRLKGESLFGLLPEHSSWNTIFFLKPNQLVQSVLLYTEHKHTTLPSHLKTVIDCYDPKTHSCSVSKLLTTPNSWIHLLKTSFDFCCQNCTWIVLLDLSLSSFVPMIQLVSCQSKSQQCSSWVTTVVTIESRNTVWEKPNGTFTSEKPK